MTVVGSYKTNAAFSGVRTKAMMRNTVNESVDKIQELVHEQIDTFSNTGALWKSVKKSGPKRISTNIWQGEVYSKHEYAAAIEYGWGPKVGKAPQWLAPKVKKAMKWDGGAGGFAFSKGHWSGSFAGHHMFQKAKTRFERDYAEDIAERNARQYLGTVDAGRRTVVI